MNVTEAREAITRSPKFWRAAVLEGNTFPLLNHPDTKVRLFETKKAAQEALRDRQKELVDEGFKRTSGSLGRGFLRLERGDELIVLGLDYPGRVS